MLTEEYFSAFHKFIWCFPGTCGIIITQLRWQVKIVNLGNKVKGIRINAGLSQRVFAMRIGTTQQNVSNYENGLTEPSLDCLIRIADEFSVSLDELVLGKSAGIEQEIFDIVASMPEDRKRLSKKILQTMLEDDNT